jgi:predicted ABC-class ATPase|tara:strand:- start:4342 stop:6120 length:1779 start_codon:yes stop_codon:yes gene_type:complete
VQSLADLASAIQRIDGRSYAAYRDLVGSYRFDPGSLHLDYIQRDPFAPPSRLRLRLPLAAAALPAELFDTPIRTLALESFLARRLRALLAERPVDRSKQITGNSGDINIDAGAQEVLKRTAAKVTLEWVELRLSVGLPAKGRTVLGGQAEQILCTLLPQLAVETLCWRNVPQDAAIHFVQCIDNQDCLRSQLAANDLVAFIADGSILPRESGVSDRPLSSDDAIAFRTPPELRVSLDLRHPIPGRMGVADPMKITGMGLPKGITLIVGGGYHGKSTLLAALQNAVVPHLPGDGRETVVSLGDAVKIRAEDGRSVSGVDISPFIHDLPSEKSTLSFCSEDASGSTSQAANISEALELGCRLLLLDEDTSATNFMIRDRAMQSLISSEDEPITPFLHRVRTLFDKFDCSTVLVMGGSGDYFSVADKVVRMQDYQALDVTDEARAIARAFPPDSWAESDFGDIAARIPIATSFDVSRGRRDFKIDIRGKQDLLFGSDLIDLRLWEQLFDSSQTRAIGYAMYWAAQNAMGDTQTLRNVMQQLEQLFDSAGMDTLDPFRKGESHPGDFARPRVYDVAAAINRLRCLQVEGRGSSKHH